MMALLDKLVREFPNFESILVPSGFQGFRAMAREIDPSGWFPDISRSNFQDSVPITVNPETLISTPSRFSASHGIPLIKPSSTQRQVGFQFTPDIWQCSKSNHHIIDPSPFHTPCGSFVKFPTPKPGQVFYLNFIGLEPPVTNSLIQ